MESVESLVAMRELSRDWRRRGMTVGLVPTMGSLHEGHLSLVRRAGTLADRVVMSLFVNPMQFSAGEDFTAYPRDPQRDAELAGRAGVDVLFLPQAAEVYPPGFLTSVRVRGLEDRLCGLSRPGHFQGVATVVAKLLAVTTPERAFFGEKDAQQLLIVRRMVRDLGLDVEVIGCPTVREADGLAMSSRNAYLSGPERQAATVLWRALVAARTAFEVGERDGERLRQCLRDVIQAEPRARLDYAEVVDVETLEPVAAVTDAALCAVAAGVGPARLIDNLTLGERAKKGTPRC